MRTPQPRQDTDAQQQDAEQERRDAEEQRHTNEEVRQTGEDVRQAAETMRVSAELIRETTATTQRTLEASLRQVEGRLNELAKRLEQFEAEVRASLDAIRPAVGPLPHPARRRNASPRPNTCVPGRNRWPPMPNGWRKRCSAGTDSSKSNNVERYAALFLPNSVFSCLIRAIVNENRLTRGCMYGAGDSENPSQEGLAADDAGRTSGYLGRGAPCLDA